MAPNTESVHETKKIFKCLICDNTFTQSGSLNRHIKTVHVGKKQFSCEKCDSEFIRKHDLKLHTKTVHEEKKPMHVGKKPSQAVSKYSDSNLDTSDKLIQISSPLTTQKRKRKNNSKYEDSKMCDSDLPAAKRSKYDRTPVHEEKDNVFVSVASGEQLKSTFKRVKKARFTEMCTNLVEKCGVLEKQVLEQLKTPKVENEGETPIQKKKKTVNKHVKTNELVIENSEFDASGEQVKFTIKMVKHVKKASFLGYFNLERKETEHQIIAKKTRKSGRLSNSNYEQFYNQKYNKESLSSENKKKFQCPLCGDKYLRKHFLEAHIRIIHEEKDSTSDPSTIDTEASIVKADEKNVQALFHAKTLNSGRNNEKSFQNTNQQGKSECLIKKEHCDDHRGVVPGGAMASPVFGRSVNPISTGGGQIMPTITTGTPGFSDLPTTLDQPEYETYDFIQYETSEGVPFLETYESVTVEQVMQIIKNEFEIELTSNILKSIEDSVIDSVLKKLSNGPAIVD